jgi:two-component system response regulator
MPNLRRILLVEDNSDDEQLTVRALRKLVDKVSIEVARDGRQALDYLADLDKTLPDVVLLDLNLPKIGGVEVLRRLREQERTHHLPVVVLSSPDEPLEIQAGYEPYASSFMHKPVTLAAFVKVAEELGMGM